MHQDEVKMSAHINSLLVRFKERGVLPLGRRHRGSVAAKRGWIRPLGPDRRAGRGTVGRLEAAGEVTIPCARRRRSAGGQQRAGHAHHPNGQAPTLKNT